MSIWDEEVDAPIYLHFLDLHFDYARVEDIDPDRIRYKFYAIEDKITPTVDELAEDMMIIPTKNDRVRHLSLPHLDYDIVGSLFFVCKSRMFFMGGRTSFWHRKVFVPNNGMLSIDLSVRDPCWERYDKWASDEFDVWQQGRVIRRDEEDDDWVYVIMDEQILRFDPYLVEETGEIIDFPFRWPAHLIASNGKDMLIYDELHNELASFDMNSLTTSVVNRPCQHTCGTWYSLQYMSDRNVMIGHFVVCFVEFSPLTGDYYPALYVYDTSVAKWLSEPVQGLNNDGFVLPFPEITQRGLFQRGSLVRVRRKVDKLALVWAWDRVDKDGISNSRAEVHWSKFILNTKDSTCFHVEDLQSGLFSGGVASLLNCTAG